VTNRPVEDRGGLSRTWRHDDQRALETARVRVAYERLAPRYDRMIAVFERLLFAGGREWACARARGRVLEIAAGTGRNLAHYPPDVQVVGTDLSPRMLHLAKQRRRALGRSAELIVTDAQDLPFPDTSFDTVVCTLGLCSIPDERRAVAEAWRVLRPGGRLLLLEHVRSPLRAVRIGQELVEPLFLWCQRDHLLREPLDAVTCSGFELEQLERSKLGIVERLAARKPPGSAAYVA
jgi:ubiquinone/menaquinone biosynthesis C-methylase UbiE